jgi:hypothetical protein
MMESLWDWNSIRTRMGKKKFEPRMNADKTKLEDGAPIKLFNSHPHFCSYTITLAPGVVCYLELDTFFETNVEKCISHLRSLSSQIKIGFPKKFELPANSRASFQDRCHYTDNIVNFDGVDDFFPDLSWEDKLRVLGLTRFGGHL